MRESYGVQGTEANKSTLSLKIKSERTAYEEVAWFYAWRFRIERLRAAKPGGEADGRIF